MASFFKKTYLFTLFLFIFFTLSQTLVFAQEATPTPTATASATPSPTSTPTPSPTSTPTSTPTATPAPTTTTTVGSQTSTTSAATDDKSQVLGEATVLGATGRQIQIAKWVVAFVIAITAFVLGLKILRANAEE